MADWVRTYINKIDEIIKDDFNTELAAIDNTLTTVASTQVFKSFQPLTQSYPHIYQTLNGESPIERMLSSANIEVQWNHFTGVRVVDVSPTASSNDVYAYVEALLKAVYKGNGNAGKLEGVVCNSQPISWAIDLNAGETQEGGLIRAGGILWNIIADYDILE